MNTSGVMSKDASTPKNPFAANLYSILFIVFGLGAIGMLIWLVTNDPVLQSVINWTPAEDGDQRPSLILAFLSQLGIVLPLLLLIAGGTFLSLGVRLRRGHILVAHWAQIALLWLAVGAGLLALINFMRALRPLSGEAATTTTGLVLPVLLPVLAIVPLMGAWWWLNNNIHDAFTGQEPLNSQQTRFAWNLLIPSLIIFVFVAARPLEQTFIRSLTDKRFGSNEIPTFVGLQNYANLLNIRFDTVPCRIDDNTGGCSIRDSGAVRWESIERDYLVEGYRTAWHVPIPFSGELRRAVAISGLDDDFLEGVGTTIVFATVSVTLELIIGLFVALVVNSSFRGRGLMRAVMLIPWAIPTVISARLWELILKDTSAGIMNRVLMDFGFIDAPQAWLSATSLQLPAAIMVDVWKTSPFMALLLLAGLQTIPGELYEAASVDGASRFRRFFAITLPLLRPTIAVALVFRMLDALRMFDLFNVLFGRQQLSIATYNYEVLVNNQRDGYASAVSMIIFLLIGLFTIIYVRILNVETG